MRFTNVLLALPFVASVFAAPVGVSPAPVSDLVEKTYAPQCDVLSVVADLHASIYAIAEITPASTQAEVEVCLQAVVNAFDHCGQALGVDLYAGVDLQVEIAKYVDYTHDKAKYDAIVKLLVEVTVKVDHFMKACPKALIRLQVIIKLLKNINLCLCGLLTCYNKVLPGCFKVVVSLCLSLGVKLNLNGLLGGVLGLLGL